jgi:hypothetical protein
VTASVDVNTYSHKQCHVALQLLNTLIPGFQEKVDNAEDLATFLAPVCLSTPCFKVLLMSPSSQLQQGANDAHSHDTSVLKKAIAEWLNHCIPSPIPPLSSASKADQGTSNNITG